MNILIVIKNHKSGFTDPIQIKSGEMVRVERRKTSYDGWIWATKNGSIGWVPEQFLRIRKSGGIAIETFDATELNITIDEQLFLIREVNGLYWVENENGKLGWVPKDNVQFREPKCDQQS